MSRVHWHVAYIGIGSNLESPVEQVSKAIEQLRELPNSRLIAVSGLYRSAPQCGREQPDYINAVAALLTQSSAQELLRLLHATEDRQGRVRTAERWESRVIDLDLLAFDGQQVDDEDLVLPHPGIAERNFVLLPWSEISPSFVVPGLTSVDRLAAGVSTGPPRIERLT